MNPISLANHAVRIHNEFNYSRDPSYKFHSDYFSDYLKSHFLKNLSQLNKYDALKCAMTISSTTAFIDWKLLPDIDSGCVAVIESSIAPLNEITRALGVSKKNIKNIEKKLKKILFLTQMDLLANNGAALVVRDVVTNFKNHVEPYATDIELSVGSFRAAPISKCVASSLNLGSSRITLQYFTALDAVSKYIELYKPDLVIFDYFLAPLTMLPYTSPEPFYAYFSHGFVPLILDNVDAILVHGGVVGEKTRGAMQELSPYHFNSTVMLPMAGAGCRRIDLGQTDNEGALIAAMASARVSGKKIAVTMCRREKISRQFIDFLEAGLDARQDLFVVCAGPGVEKCRGLISSDRALFVGGVTPELILENADIYIETFPEHQGLSAIDAMRAGVPVLCLNNDENRHLLLSRRPASGVARSIQGLLNILSSINNDHLVCGRILSEQADILSGLAEEEARFWPTIFDQLTGGNGTRGALR